MKVLHIIGGGDTGGAKPHVLSLVKELGKSIDVKLVPLREGPFAEDAIKMGIDTVVLPGINIYKTVKEILRIVDEEKYELIHSHGAKANMVATIAAKKRKLPTVTTVHSDYKLDYLHSLPKALSFGIINRFALRYIDWHVAVSENFKKMLADRGFDRQSIYILYNGIDINIPIHTITRKEFLQQYGLSEKIDENDILIGILARLHPVKGVDIFIKAAKEASLKNQNLKFLIAGDGDERKNLENKVKSCGLSDKCFFLGWVDRPFEFLGAIDISVLASHSETFPYSILEGALLDRATISSDVGGLSDLIKNGETGFLFKAGDYNALAAHMITLAQEGELREKIGKGIGEKTRKIFSLTNMANTQLEIYRSIFDLTERGVNRKNKYEAMISGWYGVNNIGDDAILKAIINDLKTYREDIRLLVLSKNPRNTREAYGVYSMNRYNFFKIFMAMKKL